MYPQTESPIIEVDGKIQFSLPGMPLFPELTDDSILKPAFDWTIRADQSGPVDAEVGYVTGGLGWKADYNVVADDGSDDVDLVGWITMDNHSGHTFENARVKLMAGDVNKIQWQMSMFRDLDYATKEMPTDSLAVREKPFEDYHLYTLNRPTTLRDGELKQVQFTAAAHVHTKRLYVYDGAMIDEGQAGWNERDIRFLPSYGTLCNPKVWAMREIVNSDANHLGIPLPKGRLRFYRKDNDGQLEFTGENDIDHTPNDETLRLYTGNAFDITGERTQTDCELNSVYGEESFTIKLRNHKSTAATVHVVEHLYRGPNWAISKHSDPFTKIDAHTIEFVVDIPPGGEKKVDYTAHYRWWRGTSDSTRHSALPTVLLSTPALADVDRSVTIYNQALPDARVTSRSTAGPTFEAVDPKFRRLSISLRGFRAGFFLLFKNSGNICSII